MKKLFLTLFAVVALAATTHAQIDYRIGTVIGDDNWDWQGYHVVGIDLFQMFPRVDFEQVTMTPWEFGELWLGFGGQWHVPVPRGSTVEPSLGLAFVNRVDRTVQLLKNWRASVSLGVRF